MKNAKITLSIFLTMKATILDTHTQWIICKIVKNLKQCVSIGRSQWGTFYLLMAEFFYT